MSDIKAYSFGNVSGNTPDIYTNHSIKGQILKIIFQRGDARAAGSLFIYESGATPELIFQKINNLQTDSIHYPFQYPVDSTNTTGSPQTFMYRWTNASIRLVGSGWGNAGSTISGLTIYYR